MITIAIADDNIESANQLSFWLTNEENFKVVHISNDGLDALQSYKNLKPDVLLLDLDMPKLNGIELLNVLPYSDQRNVIIISGSAFFRSKLSNVDKVKAIFQKPYDYQELVRCIKEIYYQKNYNSTEKELVALLKNLKFDSTRKGTRLLKSAILVSYQNPSSNLEYILNIVKVINKEKNTKTVHSLIDKELGIVYSKQENIDLFCEYFPNYYGIRPTSKHFIDYVVYYLQSTPSY
ncbi:MAG: response regulator [Clostridia bacterium]|nr:response regulator [Clostridia bacterium]